MAISDRQILEGALVAWNKYGFQRATIRRIADAAGVGEMTVLRHFPDKQDLMRAALAWEIERFVGRLSLTGELRVDLSNLAKAYQSLFSRRGRLVLYMVLEWPNESGLHELAPIITEATNYAASIVAQYQSSGDIQGTDPWEAQLALIAPLILPLLRQDPSQQLPGGPTTRVDEFLGGWGRKLE